MTKNDLADMLIGRTNFTRSQALKAIDDLTECISDSLIHGQDIFLRGFGTFKIIHREARKARDVRQSTMIDVPAHNVVKFIPSIELKKQIR